MSLELVHDIVKVNGKRLLFSNLEMNMFFFRTSSYIVGITPKMLLEQLHELKDFD